MPQTQRFQLCSFFRGNKCASFIKSTLKASECITILNSMTQWGHVTLRGNFGEETADSHNSRIGVNCCLFSSRGIGGLPCEKIGGARRLVEVFGIFFPLKGVQDMTPMFVPMNAREEIQTSIVTCRRFSGLVCCNVKVFGWENARHVSRVLIEA